MARTIGPLPLHSDDVGFDNAGNLAIKSSKIIFNHDAVEQELEVVNGTVSVNGNNTLTVALKPGDGSTQVQAAYDALSALGGGVIQLPIGTVTLLSAVTVKDNVVVRGYGMGVSFVAQGATGFIAFTRNGSFTDQLNYAAFEDFTVTGTWLTNQSQSSSDRHFQVFGCKRLRFQNVESVYCRFMAITAAYCDEVIVTGCRIRYSARDAINLTACRRRVVTFNHITGCSDDAIACHQTNAAGNPPLEGDVITNNTIEDSYGIKCLGISKSVIANNTLRRVKGYGIYTLVDTAEGTNDQVAVTITGNSITDVINATFWGGGSLCVGIYVGNASKSWVEPVQGAGTPVITLPETLYYLSNGASSQNAGAQGIVIANNSIIGFTMPAVANASLTAANGGWGFGQSFSKDGFIDLNLTSGFKFSQTGIRFSGPFLSALVSDNSVRSVGTPISLQAANNTLVKQLRVQGNQFIRYSGHGVDLEHSADRHGKVDICDNTFDGDPYFESVNRTAGPDGTWSAAAQAPTAADLVHWKGAQLRGNTFRNLNQITHTDANTLVDYSGNTYFMQPAAACTIGSSNNSNKGIRSQAGAADCSSRIVWEDSDPTSATYGQELFRQGALANNAIPSAGYYVAGQFVFNNAFATATQTLEAGATDPTPQYTILGWKRLTTSNAHVLNTDWREFRCLTGN